MQPNGPPRGFNPRFGNRGGGRQRGGHRGRGRGGQPQGREDPLQKLIFPMGNADVHETSRLLADLARDADPQDIIHAFYDHPNNWLVEMRDRLVRLPHEGSNPKRKWFWGVIVPLLRIVTEPRFSRSPAKKEVTFIFRALHGNPVSQDANPDFEVAVLFCTSELASVANAQPVRLDASQVLDAAAWTVMAQPLVGFFHEIMRRFPEEAGHPLYARAVDCLNRMVQLAGSVQEETTRKLADLPRMRTRWDEAGERPQAPAAQAQPIRRPMVEGGPGVLHVSGQARHDNDFVDFREIRLTPTQRELDPQTPLPYLPDNAASAWHHLTDVPEQVFQLAPQIARDFVHLDDARRLDTHFRLLREDMVEPLRQKEERSFPELRVLSVTVTCTPKFGFEVQFQDPFAGKAKGERIKRWEERSRRWLQQGSLVSLERGGELVFASVVDRQVAGGLVPDDGLNPRIVVSVRDADGDAAHQQLLKAAPGPWIMQQASGACQDVMRSTDPADSASFFAYRPVLLALQRTVALPFAGRLGAIPPGGQNFPHRVMPAPAFVRETTRFNLSAQAMDSVQAVQLERCDLAHPNAATLYGPHLKLDANQFTAFRSALLHEVGIIQGPPGTGKSFVGAAVVRTLLDSFVRDNSVAPILCLWCAHKCSARTDSSSMTNHALDQFLEELLDGPLGHALVVVRVGSRSKNPRMEPLSLFNHVRQGSTQNSRRKFAKNKEKLETLQSQVDKARHGTWDSLKEWLEPSTPNLFYLISDENSDVDTEGFTVVRQSKKNSDWLDQWVTGGKPGRARTGPPLNLVEFRKLSQGDLNASNRIERGQFVKLVRETALQDACTAFIEAEDRAKADKCADELRALRVAHVIGMTTSKAADCQDLLEALQPKVIVCEEAAEILEAHLLAAISGDTQHLVLIGDHLQLRPKVETYDLTRASRRGVDLDVSLFERLVEEKTYPVCTLEAQRRMRPEIANLLRASLYPRLLDDASTLHRAHVRGVFGDVVFFNHQQRQERASEDGAFEAKTHRNMFEAKLVARFALFLLQQGYSGQKAQASIAVLTPYLGQLAVLRQELSALRHDELIELSEYDEADLLRLDLLNPGKSQGQSAAAGNVSRTTVHERLRLSTVDNFQGEEADIVLISTVRNNPKGNIGFLNDDHRVNVMLSRARLGMYVFGDIQTLEKRKTGMWPQVLGAARQSGMVHSELKLVCQRHPETIMSVTSVQDFAKLAPDGGCSLPCDARLNCGHVCKKSCHPDDQDHVAYLCRESCALLCVARLHACPRLCFEDCGECLVGVPPTPLPGCGHIPARLQCWQASKLSQVECLQMVPIALPCGHVEIGACGGRQIPLCRVKCETVMECGHSCALPLCTHGMAQRHECRRTCSKPRSLCDHPCPLPCHAGPCPPCEQRCARMCSHSTCQVRGLWSELVLMLSQAACSAPCAVCVEGPCAWACAHFSCLDPCGVPCSRRMCNESCGMKLSCGHACPSVCGEVCPSPKLACLTCSPGRGALVVDVIEGLSFAEVLEPVIVLRCGHVYTLETLDGHMDLSSYYDAEGRPLPFGLETISTRPVKVCPECRGSMAQVRRYSRVFKRRDLEHLGLKFLVDADAKARGFFVEACKVMAPSVPRASDPAGVKEALRDVASKAAMLIGNGKLEPLFKAYQAAVASAQRRGGVASQTDDAPRPATQWTLTCQLLVMSSQIFNSDGTPKTDLELFQDLLDKSIAALLEQHNEVVCLRGIKLAVALIHGLGQFRWNASVLKTLENLAAQRLSENGAKVLKQLLRSLVRVDQDRAEAMDALRIAMQDVGSNPGWNGQGHMFQCGRCGFMYGIGDCGGAMQEVACPGCDGVIGGNNHRLADGNVRVAARPPPPRNLVNFVADDAADLAEDLGDLALF